MSPFDEDIMD